MKVMSWPVYRHPDSAGLWLVKDDAGTSGWLDEKAARRYAATPVVIDALQKALELAGCLRADDCSETRCWHEEIDELASVVREALKEAGEER